MAQPNQPGGSGTSPGGAITGGVSWFGGPGDPTSGPTTASGAPVTTPGIAVNNQSTLGGWWLMKLPNGAITLVRQTDIGPANFTGRTFDFLYSLLPFIGYTQQSFPTSTASSPSNATGVYIGKADTIAELSSQYGAAISTALTSIGATAQQQNTLVGQLDNASGTRNNANVIAVLGSGKAKSNVSTTPGSEATASGPLSGINLPNPLSPLEAIVGFVTSGKNWLRLGEVLMGALLLLLGFRALTGGEGNPVTVVGAAARKVAR